MAKHAKKRNFFGRNNNDHKNISNSGSKNIENKEGTGSSFNIDEANVKSIGNDTGSIPAEEIARQEKTPEEKNFRYIFPVVIFSIVALISWCWVLLYNPVISNAAEPFINKYFPGFINIFSKKQEDEKKTADASDESIKNNQANNTGTTQDNETDGSSKPGSTEKEEKESKRPSIQLKIYEGPKYNEDSQTCYYKVAAAVTGDPKPKVRFSRDDSNGSLGDNETQINLKINEKTYVLTATASNEHGTVMDSMTLVWGCNSSPVISEIKLSSDIVYVNKQYEISAIAKDPDGDSLTFKWSVSGGFLENDNQQTVKWNTPSAPENYEIRVEVTDSKGAKDSRTVSVYAGSQKAPETTSADTTADTSTPSTTAPPTTTTTTEPSLIKISVPKKKSEGGYMEYGGQTNAGGNIYAGDSSNNQPCAGFISFDITSMLGKNVASAVLQFSSASIYGDPLEYADGFWINVVNWGAEPITQEDFNITGTAIQSFANPAISCNSEKLKNELQKAINEGKSRFQIRVHFSGPYSDNDDGKDGWEYLQSNISLDAELQ